MRWLLLALPLTVAGCKNISGGQAEPGTVGAQCAEGTDCTQISAPECLRMPGGYCSEACAGGAFDCDEQSICEQLFDQAFYCLDGCLTENGNADCRDDYRCSSRPDVANLDGSEVGVCLPRCETDADCETGRRCNPTTGDCLPRGELSTGAACGNNEACNGGLCIRDPRFRGGYCSARCGSHFEGCEPGSTCHTLPMAGGGAAAVCLADCDGDATCRTDERYVCRQVDAERGPSGDLLPVSVCLPRCESDADCADGDHCDATSGACEPGIGEPNPVGAFCAAAVECQSGRCIDDPAWRNGYCTAACDLAAEGTCPEGSACAETAVGATCLAACAGDLDCRLGYVCEGGGCAPVCQTDEDCPGERVCDVPTGRCFEEGSGETQVNEVVLAESFTVRGSLSEPLELDVPEGAIGFALMAEGAGRDLIVFGEITDPTGRAVYDFEQPLRSPLRAFPTAGQVTQMVPTSPRSTPTPGAWKVRLIKDGGQADVRVTARVKTASGIPDTGTLDVNFFFVGVEGLDAASARSDDAFNRAVDEFRALYAGRGIRIGQAGYCDVTPADADRFGIIDSVDGTDSELAQMFQLSGRAGDLGCLASPTLDFFLVEEIVGGRAGYIILGIAGGIPGPPGVGGTVNSGVAVTMAGFRRDPEQTAQTMAHEGGHYLGLFHTTEAEGSAFDPLPDTPECSTANDDNDDGIVDFGECLGGRGAENLMFWAAGREARDITGDQGFVLLRNPALR